MSLGDPPPPPPPLPRLELLPFAQGVALMLLGGGQLWQIPELGWENETPLYAAIFLIGAARFAWAVRQRIRATRAAGLAAPATPPPATPAATPAAASATPPPIGFFRLLAINFGGLVMLACLALLVWNSGSSGAFREMLSILALPFAIGLAIVLAAMRGRRPGLLAIPPGGAGGAPLGALLRAIGSLFIACGLLIVLAGGCALALSDAFGGRGMAIGALEIGLVALPFAIGFFLTWLAPRTGRRG